QGLSVVDPLDVGVGAGHHRHRRRLDHGHERQPGVGHGGPQEEQVAGLGPEDERLVVRRPARVEQINLRIGRPAEQVDEVVVRLTPPSTVSSALTPLDVALAGGIWSRPSGALPGSGPLIPICTLTLSTSWSLTAASVSSGWPPRM